MLSHDDESCQMKWSGKAKIGNRTQHAYETLMTIDPGTTTIQMANKKPRLSFLLRKLFFFLFSPFLTAVCWPVDCLFTHSRFHINYIIFKLSKNEPLIWNNQGKWELKGYIASLYQLNVSLKIIALDNL